ncbi:hypothetical protein KBTX_00171 [wastewater metagenome]|uniref:Uncharacterized protein n=2 Tax=unclassified sequences TaxID=12908 RepID=A0A5B8R5T0_9ZZZZ|nr:hypothetical protein KBTEX_00171 [uncultured organism]
MRSHSSVLMEVVREGASVETSSGVELKAASMSSVFEGLTR